jgi:RHS repeat-associated protein
MLTTDDTGTPSLPGVGDGFVAYTAFGEILDASGSPGGGDAPQGFPRYQYAGAWGYETGGFGDDPGGPTGNSHLLALHGVNPDLPPVTLQHVGRRWYDPALGRFVQRDPIGIRGGLNVYECVHSNPLARVDPLGLEEWTVVESTHWTLLDEYEQQLANGGTQTIYVYQRQELHVTYRTDPETGGLLGVGGVLVGLEGLAFSALGGPPGICVYLAAVGVALSAGGAVHNALPPKVVKKEWVNVGQPIHTIHRLPGWPQGRPQVTE